MGLEGIAFLSIRVGQVRGLGQGGCGSFQEVFPDNGDMDFLQVMRSLRDVGYKYMIMPDHVPKHDDDPSGSQAFAFCYGYLNALIKAVNSEVAA